jgi:hypothetical protein
MIRCPSALATAVFPDTQRIGRTVARDYIEIMTIVQVSWCDSERDIRRNYPSAFDGIPERFSSPMAEYLFLDSIEHVQELRTRITEHLPTERQPYMQTLLTCAGTVSDHWSAIATRRYQ